MMILFIIWISLIIYSIFYGAKGAIGFQMHMQLADLRTPNYTFGLHHQQYLGTVQQDGEVFQIDTVTIGVAFVALEVEFYRRHKQA